MIVGIERIRGELTDRNCAAAWLGFRELGYEILFYDQGSVDALPADPEVIVVGTIASVWRALERIGVPRPDLSPYPDELRAFVGRRLWTSTLGEVRVQAEAGGEPVFVKPVHQHHKLFTGRVVAHWRDLIVAGGLPDDIDVWCSEVVRFRSEYRGFVSRGELVGCKHYAGSFRIFPDFAVIDRAVAAFTTAPAAYGIDFGVTDDGRTLLVEVNDGYSLGAYGLDSVIYARLLTARWRELTADVAASA